MGHGFENNRRGRISEYADQFPSAQYTAVDRNLDHNPLWNVNVDVALPCATQNELNGVDASNLVANSVTAVAEGKYAMYS